MNELQVNQHNPTGRISLGRRLFCMLRQAKRVSVRKNGRLG
ncbi:hypothetical protein KIS4809_2987 [Bacillus sp. ZZV12-4809]|nr:hypothetical protein KIS4809_2987 [Bacillus sp. ZZV12-4809]